MANKYVEVVKDAVDHSDDDHDSAMRDAADALSGFITDADRAAWFSETNSRMTRNISQMDSAVKNVFTDKHYVQIEPLGSDRMFGVYEHNN